MDQQPKHIAVAGATGAVGIEILECLEQRNFPVSELTLLASARSAGKTLASISRSSAPVGAFPRSLLLTPLPQAPSLSTTPLLSASMKESRWLFPR